MKEHHTDCITDAKQITCSRYSWLEDAKKEIMELWDF